MSEVLHSDQAERDDLEFKQVLDATAKRDQLRLVKLIVAMANTNGGRILIGVTDDGERVGVPEDVRPKWDPARLGDLIEKYINPERVKVAVSFDRDGCPTGRIIVELSVQQHPNPPLVICRDGQSETTRITKGSVLVRNNTKVEPASRSDYVHWQRSARGEPSPPFLDVTHDSFVSDRATITQSMPPVVTKAVAVTGETNTTVTVLCNGSPIAGATVIGLLSNTTWKQATTSRDGVAHLALREPLLPRSVFVAAEGYKAYIEREWVPEEQVLTVDLAEIRGGGSIVCPSGTGYIPGLTGRLNPILDSLGRTYIYADNISVNGGQRQPVGFTKGKAMLMTDADGNEFEVCVVEIIGRSSLLEYWGR